MAGWGWSLESLKSKVQEASEKVVRRAGRNTVRVRDACAVRGHTRRLGVCVQGGHNCIPAKGDNVLGEVAGQGQG
jgi:hypothetical protein